MVGRRGEQDALLGFVQEQGPHAKITAKYGCLHSQFRNCSASWRVIGNPGSWPETGFEDIDRIRSAGNEGLPIPLAESQL
jgi:hypothetical protein